MQKQVGIVVGAAVILFIIAIIAFNQFSKTSKTSSETSSSQKTESSESLTRGSIANLLTSGKNVNCTMNYPDGKGSGTIYVSGKKMRGDFTVNVETIGEVKSSMIQDGEYAYMWSDADKKGTKFKVSGIPAPSPTADSNNQSVDLNQEVDLKCSSWGVDPSKFTVPSDVEFTDMSAMMEKVQDQSGAIQNNQSNLCDSITDPQDKAACVSALSGSGQ